MLNMKYNSSYSIEKRLPLSPAQLWWRQTNQPILNLSLRGIIRQPISVDDFQKAWQEVIDQNEGLRTIFPTGLDSEEQHVIIPEEPFTLHYEDVTNLSKKKIEDYILDLQDHLNSEVDLTKWPLLKVAVLKEEQVFHFLLILPTLIGDLLTVKTLMKKVLLNYKKISMKIPLPKSRKVSSYEVYIDFLESQSIETVDRIKKSWNLDLFNSQSIPLDFENRRNNYFSERMETIFWDIPSYFTEKSRKSYKYTATMYQFIWLALHNTFASWMDQRHVTMCERSIGRNLGTKLNHFNIIGFYAVDHPVTTAIESDWGVEQQLRYIGNLLEEGSLKGAIYNSLHSKNPQQYPLPNEASQIRLDYAGRMDNFQYSQFEITSGVARFSFSGKEPDLNYAFQNVGRDFRVGIEKRDRLYALDISAFVHNNTLKIGIYYSNQLHKITTIQKLASKLVEELNNLTASAENANIRCIF